MTVPALGLLIGLIMGYACPVSIPMAYTKLFSIALLASLDSALGGLRAAVNDKFDNTVFITGDSIGFFDGVDALFDVIMMG